MLSFFKMVYMINRMSQLKGNYLYLKHIHSSMYSKVLTYPKYFIEYIFKRA